MQNNQNKFKNKTVKPDVNTKNLRRNEPRQNLYNYNNDVDEDLENNSIIDSDGEEKLEETNQQKKSINTPRLPKLPNLLKPNKNSATKATVKGLKNLKGLGMFISKYKIIIIISLVILFVLGICVLSIFDMFASAEGSGSGSGSYGYYDPACNFNETEIDYSDGTNSYASLKLDEFVMGATYAYIKDGSYSDETVKTLILILKTNVLSLGNYSNTSQNLTLNNFGAGYVSSDQITNNTLYTKINNIYNNVSEEIYVSASYNGTISNLSSADSLTIDENTLSKIEELQASKKYNEILDELYNSTDGTKRIYKISDNCTYYTLTENDKYWWPIGSSAPTNGNIYGGSPTATKITSYFGPRALDGGANHGAIDIAASCQNNLVIAAKSGTVQKVITGCDNNGYLKNNCGGGFGNYVTINHGDGMITIYAHLYPNSITVKVGDKVEQGQKLGLVGSSGRSTGCHLHFEMRLNGEKVDPLDYVDPENPRPVTNYGVYVDDSNPKTTSEIKKALCMNLKKNGYSDNANAGILANVAAEGSFALNNLEGCYEKGNCCFNGTYGYCKHPEIGEFGSDEAYTAGVDSGAYPRNLFINDRAGYGLIQWTFSNRKAGLYDYSKYLNKSIASFTVQYGFLLKEIKEDYPTTYKYITGNYSAYDITKNFCLDYESPKNEQTSCPKRAQTYASNMLTYVQNNCS